MEAKIAEQRRTRRSPGTTTVIAGVGAIAFAAASVWYGLAVQGITVAREPVFAGHETRAERFQLYFGWVVSTLPQERFYVSLAILAFVCLAAVGTVVIGSMRPKAPLAHGAALVLALGTSLWIIGNVVQLGGHRAVGIMATHGNPMPTVGSIFFTIDLIDDAFETAAFAAIGVAMLLCAWVGTRAGARAWGRFTGALGVISLVVAAGYIADEGDVVNVLLLALGVVILPVWLVWTGVRVSVAGPGSSAS